MPASPRRRAARTRCAAAALPLALSLLLLPGAAAAAPTATSTPDTLDIRHGRAAVVDGVLSPGEWDDATPVALEVEPGWTVAVRIKHDDANLFVAFSGLRRGTAERYPEVTLDMRGDRAATWGADDHWFHASYRDCDATARFNQWDCAPTRPGWRANNFPVAGDGVVEMRIAYARIGLVPGRERRIGIAFNVTDTRERWSFWPREATLASPATWAVASSPARWGAPRAARPLAGRLDTLRLTSAAGDSLRVRVYLPAGYDSTRRYPAIYTFMDGVYFDHPAVGLPHLLDSAIRVGVPRAVVVALPAVGPDGFHHPDSPAGAAWQRMVVEEIVPAVERAYAVRAERDFRRLLGFSSGANVVVDLGVRHPAVFGRVAAQSPGWMDWDGARGDFGRIFLDEALANVRSGPAAPLPAFWFVWGDGDMAWEARSRVLGASVIAALRARGAAVMRAGDVPGEHGLHLVTRSLSPALDFLLGSAPPAS